MEEELGIFDRGDGPL